MSQQPPPYGQPEHEYDPPPYGQPDHRPRAYASEHAYAWAPRPDRPDRPPPRTRFRDVGTLQRLVLLFSGITTLIPWLQTLMAPLVADDYRRAAEQGRPAHEVLTAYDGVAALGLLSIGAWICTALWLDRARANALLVEPHGQRRGEVWCWLGWIVPVVSLWFPLQLVQDTRRATRRAAGLPPGDPIGWWWGFWLLSLVVGQGTDRIPWSGTSGPAWQADLAVAVVTTIAFVLWVRIVRQVSEAQAALAVESSTNRE